VGAPPVLLWPMASKTWVCSTKDCASTAETVAACIARGTQCLTVESDTSSAWGLTAGSSCAGSWKEK